MNDDWWKLRNRDWFQIRLNSNSRFDVRLDCRLGDRLGDGLGDELDDKTW